MSSLSPVSTEQHSRPSSAPETYLAYLRDQDDPMRWVAPRMFDRCAELRRFQRFVDSLEARLGRKLDYELGSGIDEGAFHGEVFFAGAVIRFSNFGRMIAVVHGDVLASRVRLLIDQVADEQGYVVIPESLLALPYSGANGLVSSEETWGSRFFGGL